MTRTSKECMHAQIGLVERTVKADLALWGAANVSRETFCAVQLSLPDAEASEQGVKHILGGCASNQPVEGEPRAAQFLGDQQWIG